MLEFVDIVGWGGTALMFGGSVLSIYKHKACWPIWLIGGMAIIYQSMVVGSYNLVVLQIMYTPLNIWGWLQWRRDDGNN